MAFLKFRGNTTSPTKPGSTTAGNAPLTNTEIDGNFASLNDGKLENSGTTNHIGNVTFGNQTSLQGTGGSAGNYTNNNLNKLVFRPTLDVDNNTLISINDSLQLLRWLEGIATTGTFVGAPYIIQHADKVNTGIAMLHADPLAFTVGTDQNPSLVLTTGNTAVTQYVRIGGAAGSGAVTDFASAIGRADLALKATTVLVNSTTASTNTYTGALVVGGGLGVGGAVYASSAVLTNALPATSGGTGINNGSSTITVGGNVTMSGAYTFTGTLTANTGVTFPTTGTLVNSAVTTLSSLASVGTITTGTWNATTIGATYGGTGINNGSNTITLSGNVSTAGAFTTSGAFGLTLTTTALTSVTLPTSGTLVNTAVTTLSSLASIGTITTGTWNGSIIGATYGGTGTGTYATGDILYASAANTLSKLNIGSTGQLLTVTAGVPAWQPAPISLPSQTGNSGKFLTTNGTTSSWADAAQSVTDDTSSTAITNYIQFTTVTSGTITATKVSSTKLYYQPSTGTLNSTTFNSLSDARFKTDLEKIKGALSKVKQLTGYTFTMTESGKRSAGLLAQDVKPVSPESIGGTEDRMTLNYDSLFGLIVEAIKEIDDKLTSIEQRLDK